MYSSKYMDCNFAGDKETIIEMAEGGMASVTTSIRRHKNKLLKLHEKYPKETKLYENNDGSIYMLFPLDWFRLPNPINRKPLTEEQKKQAAERMKKARDKKKENQEEG